MRVYILGAGASAPDGALLTADVFKKFIEIGGGKIDGQPNTLLLSSGSDSDDYEKEDARIFLRVLERFDQLEKTQFVRASRQRYQGKGTDLS